MEIDESSESLLRAAIDRENSRSRVRIVLTYLFAVFYVGASLITIIVVTFGGGNPPTAQTVLSIYAGISAASLGIIGYWFGNRDLTKGHAETADILSRAYRRDTPATDAQFSDGTAGGQGVSALPPLAEEIYSDAEVQAAFEEAMERFGGGRHPDVVGVTIGLRQQAGQMGPQRCIRLHVKRKVADVALDADETRRLPKRIAGVIVDVAELSHLFTEAYQTTEELRDANKCYKPVLPPQTLASGVQIEVGSKAGSAGMLVKGRADGAVSLLTALHVVGLSPGRTVKSGPQTVGKSRAPTGAKEALDAVLVEVDTGVRYSTKISGLSDGLSQPIAPIAGRSVRKIGNQTGLSAGVISDVGSLNVSALCDGYELPDTTRLMIIKPDSAFDQCDPTKISAQGDSGSIWFRQQGPGEFQPVGMHVCGGYDSDAGARFAVAVDLTQIFHAMELIPA